ncbi:MAG: chalcone isomerase family protein [Gammaproteobacteria bacterium]|nr:chalcone isomerase family protein [Gammaproteobacteria bacterium]
MRRLRCVLLVGWVLWCVPALAVEVAGVNVPDRVVIDGADQPLLLNGAGIRKKFFISVYVGALYLAERQDDVQRLLAAPPANRVLMHFVYSTVAKRKLDEAWRDGFADNLDAAALAAVAERLETFVGLFGDMRDGDHVWLDFVPGQGTAVRINGELRGTIAGDDFNAALLAVWLGPRPVSEALKKAMVGDDRT